MPENQNNQEIPGEKPNEQAEKKSDSSGSMLKTAFILGILTFSSALILSVLNLITAPVIADKLQAEKTESVKNLFGGDIIAEELLGYEDLYVNYTAQVHEILLIRNNSNREPAGYCVTVSPKGFSGNIDILVAVNSDCTVIDTEILSMKETASGMKIGDDSFREQFKSKTLNIMVNEVNNPNSIDTIANATVSSKAFLDGVNTALAVVNNILIAETKDISANENENENEEREEAVEVNENE